MFYDLECCVRGSSGCCDCCGVCCACFSLRTQSVKSWVIVLWWSMCVWCVVCLYKLCVSATCVWVVCLCKSVVVVCVWYCEWVSVCVCSCFVWLCGHLFMCSLVLVFMVCVCVSVCLSVCLLLCATTLCCVVALNNRQTHTHHEHEHHTAHENTHKPHDSRFQNETDIRWIKGDRTPSIFIYSTTLMWAVMITSRFALQIQVLLSKVCN